MSNERGALYVVATPIGNLDDISERAINVLSSVDTVLAEDTRHSARLLDRHNIRCKIMAVHEHNESRLIGQLVERAVNGERFALISDAGTPLISDPGFPLVRAMHQHRIPVVPVPGPCAMVAALCVSGLPTDKFVFEGFLPTKAARLRRLRELADESRTLVFYESTHRLVDSLADMITAFGRDRLATLAKELTKTFESVQHGTLESVEKWLVADSDRGKGEFVVVVGGRPQLELGIETAHQDRILRILLEDLPATQAASLGARITGAKRNAMYKRALALRGSGAA